jgi:hypothetical protein
VSALFTIIWQCAVTDYGAIMFLANEGFQIAKAFGPKNKANI